MRALPSGRCARHGTRRKAKQRGCRCVRALSTKRVRVGGRRKWTGKRYSFDMYGGSGAISKSPWVGKSLGNGARKNWFFEFWPLRHSLGFRYNPWATLAALIALCFTKMRILLKIDQILWALQKTNLCGIERRSFPKLILLDDPIFLFTLHRELWMTPCGGVIQMPSLLPHRTARRMRCSPLLPLVLCVFNVSWCFTVQ